MPCAAGICSAETLRVCELIGAPALLRLAGCDAARALVSVLAVALRVQLWIGARLFVAADKLVTLLN
jgi:hypothetical protein